MNEFWVAYFKTAASKKRPTGPIAKLKRNSLDTKRPENFFQPGTFPHNQIAKRYQFYFSHINEDDKHTIYDFHQSLRINSAATSAQLMKGNIHLPFGRGSPLLARGVM